MKNRIKIFVDGKSFTLVGEETEMHMQAVASYIDGKIIEIRKNAAAVKVDTSLAYILSALNVADDYFKEKEKVAELEGRNLGLSTRLEELVIQIDGAMVEIAQLKESLGAAQKQAEERVKQQPMKEDIKKIEEKPQAELETKPHKELETIAEESKVEEPILQTEEKPHYYPMGLKGGQAERTMTQKAKKGKRRKR